MVVDVEPVADTEQPDISMHYQIGSPPPILNYVHHSANVLRKVRLGQPLEAALHAKPLLKLRLNTQEVANSTQLADASLVDTVATLGSAVNFRRDRGLQLLPDLLVIRDRRPKHVLPPSPPFRRNAPRNMFPSAEVPIVLKTRKNQNTVSNDRNAESGGALGGFNASSDQHNAALIIARFFRSVCRLDNAADRAREILRRRWRDQHPEKYRAPLFELTNIEQLRVLQLYNPHLYGSQKPTSPVVSKSTSIRLSGVPQMEQHKRLRQMQILARMNKAAELLNETSRQKTQTAIATVSTLHEVYQRQSLASYERPKTVLGRERLQQAHDLVTFSKTPPNFRYKTTPQSHIQMTHALKSLSTLDPLPKSVTNK